jgi:hypothetical protein
VEIIYYSFVFLEFLCFLSQLFFRFFFISLLLFYSKKFYFFVIFQGFLEKALEIFDFFLMIFAMIISEPLVITCKCLEFFINVQVVLHLCKFLNDF